MKLFIHLTVVFLLCFSAFSSAEPDKKTKDMQVITSLKIDELTEDDVMLPNDMIKELNVLIKLSEEKNWIKNLLKANTLKAELLIFLEKIPQAKALFETYHPIAKANNFKKIEIRLQLVALSLSNSASLTPDIEKHINNLEETARNWENKVEAGSIYNATGHSLYVHGKLDRALVSLQKAYTIFVNVNDSANLGDTLNSIANLYQEIGDLDKAIEYLQQAVEIKRGLNDSLSVSIILYNLGDAYIKNNQYDLAIVVLTESLQISLHIEDDLGIVWTKQSLADLRLKQSAPNKALAFYLDTEPSFKESGDKRKLIHTYLGIFDCYILLNDQPRAELYLLKAIPILEHLTQNKYQADVSQREATLAYVKGEHEKAYTKLLTYITYIEEAHKQEKNRGVQKLKIGFESELKNNQNKILQKENELQQLKIRQQDNERLLWFFIIFMALILLFIIAIVLIKQMKSRKVFQNMALSDHLTNSPNRRAILQQAENALTQTQKEGNTLYICLVDLDLFKKVNDTYGHDVGDEVLKAFASSCKSVLRKQDYFGRFGGEEWLFVFTEMNEKNIQNIFTRLRYQLNCTDIKGYPRDKPITFSVGGAIHDNSQVITLEELIAKSDENLYRAKHNGRDQINVDETFYRFNMSDESD